MIIHDLHVMRPILGPAEADTPLPVDPNAVLTRAVAWQSFQTIAGQGGQIAERFRTIQKRQATGGPVGERLECRDSMSFKEAPGAPIFEVSNHMYGGYFALRVP